MQLTDCCCFVGFVVCFAGCFVDFDSRYSADSRSAGFDFADCSAVGFGAVDFGFGFVLPFLITSTFINMPEGKKNIHKF
ncbi:hypothetical protein HUG20_05880 [Salicibibacter cibi]|uniref:Uncharacterized protein n=1 Tax=Salicibibacter cibi TaxID=2743001 RepID=A0A7T6Z9W8_9BACI|nr:hypothetical protein HUG20_05880 [Salicibibacter cibi]